MGERSPYSRAPAAHAHAEECANHTPSAESESECPGYCGAQDTFYVGTLKGVGRIYQQTFIDTYSKVVLAKLYDRKTPLTAADLLNDRVLPFFEQQEISLLRMFDRSGHGVLRQPRASRV